MSINCMGFPELHDKLKRIGDVPKFFDSAVKEVAVLTQNNFVHKTPLDPIGLTPHTKNMWQFPNKMTESLYYIDNTKTSQDGKHAIAGILNYGRKEIFPKRTKYLFIPKSKRAKAKRMGEKIPKNWIRGTKHNYEDANVDFFLSKKSAAVPATNFITDIEKKSEKVLVSLILKEIRKEFNE